jgi:hypothetical protein
MYLLYFPMMGCRMIAHPTRETMDLMIANWLDSTKVQGPTASRIFSRD